MNRPTNAELGLLGATERLHQTRGCKPRSRDLDEAEQFYLEAVREVIDERIERATGTRP